MRGPKRPAIASSRATRSSVEGWVLKIEANERPDSGLTMKRCDVAGLLSIGIIWAPRSSFLRALASASGFPEISAPVASAPYSRVREFHN